MSYAVAHPRNWVDQFFNDVDRNWRSAANAFNPAVDVTETAEAYFVRAELPGVAKENLSVEVKENVLTLSGNKEAVELGEGAKAHYAEARHGAFARRFALPRNAKADAVEATFKDGVLTLRVPKADEAKPKAVEIR